MEKSKIYQDLFVQIQALFQNESDLVANMSNMTSLIFERVPRLNGTSFYRWKNDELILGPFQGRVACMHIPLGKGVCGKVAATKTTEIVPDVHQFPGHIACDARSKSEIVVPVFDPETGNFFGVLDLDSPYFSNFDSVDAEYLEKIVPLVFGS
ncbi:GAF domain-containing protein [Sporolactobacillus spathodeae]|uniref:GAF domain-containing protein n=1 Tax=Sporolactobacillus spathodeae TaxID=1465502 RepID=A0ABS2QAS7_9BACL|nr:GAF domain-containing protein [Sporolactobacillus spathodeae]MBM7658909.1 GAF domain-containing protein [Sporolactobacillus spathodeae]